MSVELPEISILSQQMRETIVGKIVEVIEITDYEKLQRLGFINHDLSEFEELKRKTIESVVSRGLVIRLKLSEGNNLLLSPEYGGKVRFQHHQSEPPLEPYHLKICFTDYSSLYVRLTGMGLIFSVKDNKINEIYVYRRDFSNVLSPLEEDFTYERFSENLRGKIYGLKAALVGREAVIVGFGNSSFQDVIYRARLHPKRKISDLTPEEKRALFNSIIDVVKERISLGGKDQFTDLHGNKGGYIPRMGGNDFGKQCKNCGTRIEKLSFGGGQVYLCPKCQR
jgi:formamidopyrimidine-DNA glycosylase